MTHSHILLTGGTGFFGKALLRHWIDRERKGQAPTRVTLLSRDPDRFATQHPALVEHHWLQLVRGDVCDAASLPQGQAFTHVLHAATDSTTGPQLTPQQRFDQIVDGTRHMLNLAVACGASRFLLTSSGGVYGAQPPDMEQIPEHCHTLPDPLNPAQAYSIGKRMAEHLCALTMQAHGLPIVVARCFAFVGPDLPLDVHFAIGNFIRDALQADSITVQGDGSPLRSYMDQRDLAQWLLALLTRGRAGQAYNVGSDHAVSIRELAHTVRDLLAPHKQVHVLGAPNPAAARNRYIPSIAKARQELGLDITISLEDAIRFTAQAHVRRTGTS
ncbi:NAD(P)-dependent oxidoreductase [Rhodoferax sp. GW822-FHT02A01]|uniref:NAD-dependent epimerase/dehydratase family protein n=1 Tax=Rhodoferax sp. GW822-FHT02A01 TaxID=3141537 RepID=UPI00315D64E2